MRQPISFTATSQVHGLQGTPVERSVEISPAAAVPPEGPGNSSIINAGVNDATRISDVEVFAPAMSIAGVFPG